MKEAQDFGIGYGTEPFIFTNEADQPYRRNVVSSAFRAGVKRAGLPRIRLHDLGHSYASAAIEEGMDIVHGSKLVEVCSWSTSHRGPLLVHAARRGHGPGPRGALVGRVQVVDVHRAEGSSALECRSWAAGAARYRIASLFLWVLRDAHPLVAPVPCSGQLGVWSVPPSLLAAIRQAPYRALTFTIGSPQGSERASDLR